MFVVLGQLLGHDHVAAATQTDVHRACIPRGVNPRQERLFGNRIRNPPCNWAFIIIKVGIFSMENVMCKHCVTTEFDGYTLHIGK